MESGSWDYPASIFGMTRIWAMRAWCSERLQPFFSKDWQAEGFLQDGAQKDMAAGRSLKRQEKGFGVSFLCHSFHLGWWLEATFNHRLTVSMNGGTPRPCQHFFWATGQPHLIYQQFGFPLLVCLLEVIVFPAADWWFAVFPPSIIIFNTETTKLSTVVGPKHHLPACESWRNRSKRWEHRTQLWRFHPHSNNDNGVYNNYILLHRKNNIIEYWKPWWS